MESKLSIWTGTFLNNYDVRDRTPKPLLTCSTVGKREKWKDIFIVETTQAVHKCRKNNKKKLCQVRFKLWLVFLCEKLQQNLSKASENDINGTFMYKAHTSHLSTYSFLRISWEKDLLLLYYQLSIKINKFPQVKFDMFELSPSSKPKEDV